MTQPKDTIFREGDLDILQALHYYSCEFPGDTYNGVPADVVREGLKGLDMFIRAAAWATSGSDPYGRPTQMFDEVNAHGELTMDIPF